MGNNNMCHYASTFGQIIQFLYDYILIMDLGTDKIIKSSYITIRLRNENWVINLKKKYSYLPAHKLLKQIQNLEVIRLLWLLRIDLMMFWLLDQLSVKSGKHYTLHH